jgi:hypothetical protein
VVNNEKFTAFSKLNLPFCTLQLSYKLLQFVCSTLPSPRPVIAHQKFNLIPQRKREVEKLQWNELNSSQSFLNPTTSFTQEYEPSCWNLFGQLFVFSTTVLSA